MNKKSLTLETQSGSEKVNYVIVNKTVYFSQVDGKYACNKDAEDIVAAISKVENINFRDFRWIDIQRPPLDESVDWLIFTNHEKPIILSWLSFDLPREVSELFE